MRNEDAERSSADFQSALSQASSLRHPNVKRRFGHSSLPADPTALRAPVPLSTIQRPQPDRLAGDALSHGNAIELNQTLYYGREPVSWRSGQLIKIEQE